MLLAARVLLVALHKRAMDSEDVQVTEEWLTTLLAAQGRSSRWQVLIADQWHDMVQSEPCDEATPLVALSILDGTGQSRGSVVMSCAGTYMESAPIEIDGFITFELAECGVP